MRKLNGKFSWRNLFAFTGKLSEKSDDGTADNVNVAGDGADDKKETVYEIADLAYHVMVLMTEMGITLGDVQKELASRHVIDHKVKQEKMTQ